MNNSLQQNYEGTHLLILVHGFQGSSYDMRSLRNNILLMLIRKNVDLDKYEFLCSSANEDSTENDIAEMGQNLANEVKYRIQEVKNIQRISFIGHSLGGLIIRAALPNLIELRLKMFTYMSLSSPHLGYMQNKSQMVEAGLWILKQLKKSKSLQQLTMEDSDEIENTYLYRLSCEQGLDWFQNIAFLSSFQDKYVPFESARMQKVNWTQNNLKYQKYQEMVENIMCKLNNELLHRIDIDFEKSDHKVIDNIIGRHAHIQFIEDQTMMRMLAHTFENLFI